VSDIFWIKGATIEKTPAALGDAVEAAGIQRAWIEEAHWVGGPAYDFHVFVNGFHHVVYRWQPGALLPDFLLHSACRLLELRERSLLLIAEEEGDLLHFAVLCSPRAVGQYNLMPHAHIAGWWALPPDGLASLPQKLEKSGYDLSCVDWMTGDPALIAAAQTAFPNAQPLEGAPSAATGRLNLLIHRLDEYKCSHGLMLGGGAEGPLLATLVER
jgi:hypothetical protein